MTNNDDDGSSPVPRDSSEVRAQLPELTAEQLGDGDTRVVISGVTWRLWQVAHLCAADIQHPVARLETSQGAVTQPMPEVRVEGLTLSRRGHEQQGVKYSDVISSRGEMVEEERLDGKILGFISLLPLNRRSPLSCISMQVGHVDLGLFAQVVLASLAHVCFNPWFPP